MDSSLTIRISEETRKRMKEVNVDWPHYIRQAIEDKIRDTKRTKSAESMDNIRAKTAHGVFDSGKSIREDRDA